MLALAAPTAGWACGFALPDGRPMTDNLLPVHPERLEGPGPLTVRQPAVARCQCQDRWRSIMANQVPAVLYLDANSCDADSIAALHADSWRRHYRGAYLDSYLDGDAVSERQ
jgi:hypothetical protein